MGINEGRLERIASGVTNDGRTLGDLAFRAMSIPKKENLTESQEIGKPET